MTDESAFHRAPRPLIGWALALLALTCVAFVCTVLFAVAMGFLKTAAQGQGVPDMTGGLAIIITALAPVCAAGAQWMHTRSAERRIQIGVSERQGAPVAPPFDSAAASAGPRPGDSP